MFRHVVDYLLTIKQGPRLWHLGQDDSVYFQMRETAEVTEGSREGCSRERERRKGSVARSSESRGLTFTVMLAESQVSSVRQNNMA